MERALAIATWQNDREEFINTNFQIAFDNRFKWLKPPLCCDFNDARYNNYTQLSIALWLAEVYPLLSDRAGIGLHLVNDVLLHRRAGAYEREIMFNQCVKRSD